MPSATAAISSKVGFVSSFRVGAAMDSRRLMKPVQEKASITAQRVTAAFSWSTTNAFHLNVFVPMADPRPALTVLSPYDCLRAL